jgi:hypothetical protein
LGCKDWGIHEARGVYIVDSLGYLLSHWTTDDGVGWRHTTNSSSLEEVRRTNGGPWQSKFQVKRWHNPYYRSKTLRDMIHCFGSGSHSGDSCSTYDIRWFDYAC